MLRGIQLNLLLNIPLIMLVFLGQQCFVQDRAIGRAFSWLLVASGLIAASIRSYFLLQGNHAFRFSVSLGLLVATLLLSLLQAIALLGSRKFA